MPADRADIEIPDGCIAGRVVGRQLVEFHLVISLICLIRSSLFYAGGGGGGSNGGTASIGGSGVGGAGASAPAPANAGNGTTNRGGGGGGARTGNGGSGGSGAFIVRYLGSQNGTGGSVSSSGGYTIHTFTGDGTFVVNSAYTIN